MLFFYSIRIFFIYDNLGQSMRPQLFFSTFSTSLDADGRLTIKQFYVFSFSQSASDGAKDLFAFCHSNDLQE